MIGPALAELASTVATVARSLPSFLKEKLDELTGSKASPAERFEILPKEEGRGWVVVDRELGREYPFASYASADLVLDEWLLRGEESLFGYVPIGTYTKEGRA